MQHVLSTLSADFLKKSTVSGWMYAQVKTFLIIYSNTCLNWTSLELTFVFVKDSRSVYTGWINEDFLHLDFI
jgi:hypothetical protein